MVLLLAALSEGLALLYGRVLKLPSTILKQAYPLGGATSGVIAGGTLDIGVAVVTTATLTGPVAIAVLVVAGVVGGGFGSFAGSAVDQTVSERHIEINWEKAERQGKWGAVFGGISAGAAGHLTGFARAAQASADAIRQQMAQQSGVILEALAGQLTTNAVVSANQIAATEVLTTVFTEVGDEIQATISHFNQQPPTTQSPPVPPVVDTPPQPPVDNEACLNKVRGLMAAAREKAKSEQDSLTSAASIASTVQTSISRATEATSIANQKISAVDRVIAQCEALPWPFDPASAQSKAEHAAKEGKSLVPIAVSYSSEACGFVQRATRESNEAALRIWHKKAAFLTKAINSKAGTLAGLIKDAQGEVQTIERMRRTMETAKKEAQQALTNLSSASEPLNSAQSTLNSMEGKITEAQGQVCK